MPGPRPRWRIGVLDSNARSRAELSRLIESDGATVVIARVAGDFPGSPVELQHAFRLDGGQIASLGIR